jgi:hypothetical protein
MRLTGLRLAAPLLAALTLAGCDIFGGPGEGGGPPEILSFTASPARISTPGESVTLMWTVTGAVTGLELEGVGNVSGSSTTVNPTATTVYTLTARNSSGEDRETTTVVVDSTEPPVTPPPPPGNDTTPPSGDFGVSRGADGPFSSDRGQDITTPDDPRVVALEPGDTFYARVAYSDPSGIAGIRVRLNNRSPVGLAGDLQQGTSVGGFTLVGTVGSCDLAARPTSVTCVYEIEVGDDVVNIDQLEGAGSEFAYVFRTYVTDTLGNESNTPPRGYVTVGEAGGGTPTPEPDPDPEPEDVPVIESFTADGEEALTVSAGETVTLAWTLSGGEAASVFLSDSTVEDDLQDVTDEDGSLEVVLEETTTFGLVATNDAGQDTAEVTVTVTD